VRPVLSVESVSVTFRHRGRSVSALRDVGFDVEAGTTVGVVGASGSGKSTLARVILGLLAPNEGRVLLDDVPLAVPRTPGFRRRVQFVQQNPRSALNPARSIGQTVGLPLVAHRIGDRRSRAARVEELLDRVGLPVEAAGRRPGDLSGGQRQRVALARALATEPDCIVLDEPTSALDVSVQARILRLLRELQEERGLSYVFISHDLPVVRTLAERVVVLESGRIVEQGATEDVLGAPTHPYTQELVAAVPDPFTASERRR
jgi:peptide/nickel transport system ATP-binding protein